MAKRNRARRQRDFEHHVENARTALIDAMYRSGIDFPELGRRLRISKQRAHLLLRPGQPGVTARNLWRIAKAIGVRVEIVVTEPPETPR